MVWILSPPGVSIVRANSLRAKSRSAPAGPGAPERTIACARLSFESVVHLPSSLKTRDDMLAAAALVKVRQRMALGCALASNRRNTRCTRTCVLPEPALAETQAEASGSEARCCAIRVGLGTSRWAAFMWRL